jgi:hypothetical protein
MKIHYLRLIENKREMFNNFKRGLTATKLVLS